MILIQDAAGNVLGRGLSSYPAGDATASSATAAMRSKGFWAIVGAMNSSTAMISYWGRRTLKHDLDRDTDPRSAR